VRRPLVIASLSLLALGCGGGSGESLSERGDELVLAFEDVGAPFRQFDRGRQLRTDLSPPRDDPNRFGREGGWRARFHRPGSPATRGPIVIDSRADLFGSPAGAERDFALYEELLDGLAEGARGRRIAAPPLAEKARAVTFDQGFPPNSVRHYVIAWRDGRVTASVSVNGFERGIRFADAIALARKQQLRISQAASG
jgi:hypothetical protein